MRRPDLAVIVFTTVLAGVLRCGTLDVQSFWFDEAVTVGLLHLDASGLLSELPRSESTPPLYYLLARAWSVPFGHGEVGLRSLSAVLGTAAVPTVWAACRELSGARAAHVAALLAAVSPLLVWYSQEARSYALLTLLSALSLWTFARLLREGPSKNKCVGLGAGSWMPGAARFLVDTGSIDKESGGSGRRETVPKHRSYSCSGPKAPASRDRWLWALCASAALATHYFAVFLVAAQAVALLVRTRPVRSLAAPLAGIGLTGAALLPLAASQQGAGLASFIAEDSLARRALQAAKQLPFGFDGPLETLLPALGILVVVAAFVLAARGAGEPPGGARVALALAAAAIAAPFVLAVGGVDYVLTRNLIPAWPALAVVVGAGLTARRAGRWGPCAAVALATAMLATTVGVALTPGWQREDWRGAVEAMGEPEGPRVVVATGARSAVPIRLYRPRLRALGGKAVGVDEVVALGQRESGGALGQRDSGRALGPDAGALRALGLRVVERRREPSYDLVRMRPTGMPTALTPAQLVTVRLDPRAAPALLFERGPTDGP